MKPVFGILVGLAVVGSLYSISQRPTAGEVRSKYGTLAKDLGRVSGIAHFVRNDCSDDLRLLLSQADTVRSSIRDRIEFIAERHGHPGRSHKNRMPAQLDGATHAGFRETNDKLKAQRWMECDKQAILEMITPFRDKYGV